MHIFAKLFKKTKNAVPEQTAISDAETSLKKIENQATAKTEEKAQ
jgi:hypothetical protein